MRQIVIIGGSAAGIRAAEEIRSVDSQSIIKVLTGESHPPFLHAGLMPFLASEIPLDKIYARAKSFYEQSGIELVFGKKISRVNFRRSHVTFEDKEKLDYDVLIITDTPQTKFPEVKGNQRQGVFGLRRVGDAAEIAKLLPTTETVVVQSQTLNGLRLAVALRHREKEVIWATAEPRILSGFLNEEAGRAVRTLVESWGIRLMEQNEIAEVLGDTDVKAVRLKNGKVIATQMVIYPDAGADLKIFKDTELQMGETIPVNVSFQTNISNVYALDDVCSYESSTWATWDDGYNQILEQQGKAVAAAVNAQGMIAEYPLQRFSCSFQNDYVQVFGQTRPGTATRVAADSDPGSKKYRQVLVEQGVAVGAVLVNSRGDADRFIQLIRERTPIETVADSILAKMQFGPTAEMAASVIPPQEETALVVPEHSSIEQA